MKAVVGYANKLDNILPIPQDPHYPRGLYTSTRAHYIQERWDTHTHTHFGPLTTGGQWVLQGLTHTHSNCLKIHRQPPHTQAHMHTATQPSTSAWCWSHLTSWVKPPSLQAWNAMIWTYGRVGTAWSLWTCTNQ